jgi:hypothetical protein
MSKIKVKCDWCDKEIPKWKCRIRKTNFCDYNCYWKWLDGRKRQPLSEETKIKIGNGNRGLKRTKEQRKITSDAGIGRKVWNTGLTAEIDSRIKKIPRTEEQKQKFRESAIKRMDKLFGRCVPGYNPRACETFDELNRIYGLNLRHAENGGEVCIMGYFVDAFDLENQLIIEYDEKYHNNQKHKRKDEIRQSNLIRVTGFTFIRIKEGDIFEPT